MLEQINRLKELALRKHYYCEDSWYSCPKAEDGCANEAEGTECNCGAEYHNAEVLFVFDRIIRELESQDMYNRQVAWGEYND